MTAGTAQAVLDMEKLNAKVGQFGNQWQAAGHKGVSEMQATSGALRVLEGGLNNNLRAAERFIANISGLGPILLKAFPVVGGIAFAGLLIKLGEEVHKFYTDFRDAGAKAAADWRGFFVPLEKSNDELAVSLDKVNIEIAKLEGRRQNTLKLELDEAKVSANELALSLDKTFHNLSTYLDGNKTGIFRQFLGEGSTYDLRLLAGGKSGVEGAQSQLSDANKKGYELVARARTEEELKNALTQKDILLHSVLNKQLEDANTLLDRYNKASQPVAPRPVKTISGATVYTEGGPGQDMAKAIEQTKQYIAVISEEAKRIDEVAAKRAADARLAQVQAANSAAKQERPLQRMTDELTAHVAESVAKLRAAGQDEAGKAIAKGMAEAIRAVETVNEGLRRQHQALLPTDPTKSATGRSFLGLTTQAARNEDETTFKNKVQEANAKLADQLQNQRAINDAIGKGWEALAKVNVEIALQRDLGAVLYNDPGHAQEVQALRTKALAAETAKHTEEVSKGNLAKRDEIALEQALVSAQTAGAEAVRLATLQHTIEIMRRNGATQESIDLEIKYYQAQRANEIAKQVSDINQQILAIKNLSAAYSQGAEAVRKAELQNKLAQIAREGDQAVPGVFGIGTKGLSAIGEDQAAQEKTVAAAAGERVNVYRNQLAELEREKAALADITVTEENRNDIARAYRDLLDAELKIMVQQQLSQRDAMSGIRAFFLEMQEQAKSTAAIMYEALNSTIDKLSDNLTRALTGQKTAWAKMFQDIGRGILKDTIKSGLQTGLGALGDLIPGVKQAKDAAKKAADLSKIGHTEANPWWVRIAGGLFGRGPSSTPGTGTGPGNILFGNRGVLGTGQVPNFAQQVGAGVTANGASNALAYGASELAAKLAPIPAMAAGGDVQPNQVYSWNENGRELFMSGAGGHIANAAETRQMLGGGGGGPVFNIDARGTDPYLTRENVVAGFRQVHSESVSQSVRAVHQQSARTPQRG